MKRYMKTIFGILILLLAWQLAASSGLWSAYVLPSPAKVGKALRTMAESGVLWKHIAISGGRVLKGFGIAFGLAFLCGLIDYGLPWMEEYYGSFLEFMRNVPPISLIALLILWFGIGETSKIIIIVLASFFPMYLNIRKGFVSCDKKLLEVGEVFGFGPWRRFFRIVLPSAVPDILVGMRVGLGYSWRAIIGAEMIAAGSGLGYLILDSQQMSRSDKVIAGILVIGVVGILCDQLFQLLIRRMVRRELTGAGLPADKD
ncbi:MAG: ABC transporter permease [Otoolea sp.]|nr:ABC transporter permease [Clostridium sp.]